METWKKYRRKNVAEMRDLRVIDTVQALMKEGVSISTPDLNAGSPRPGDKIARNPLNYEDKWLVAKKYFEDNFEEII